MITFFFLSTYSFANTPELSLTPYIKLHESLVKGDLKEAVKLHIQLCAGDLKAYKNNYKDCAKKFPNLDEMKDSFKSLSEIYINHGAKKELTNYEVFKCPMNDARWIQKKGVLQNPYYGSDMLTCGEKVSK